MADLIEIKPGDEISATPLDDNFKELASRIVTANSKITSNSSTIAVIKDNYPIEIAKSKRDIMNDIRGFLKKEYITTTVVDNDAATTGNTRVGSGAYVTATTTSNNVVGANRYPHYCVQTIYKYVLTKKSAPASATAVKLPSTEIDAQTNEIIVKLEDSSGGTYTTYTYSPKVVRRILKGYLNLAVQTSAAAHNITLNLPTTFDSRYFDFDFDMEYDAIDLCDGTGKNQTDRVVIGGTTYYNTWIESLNHTHVVGKTNGSVTLNFLDAGSQNKVFRLHFTADQTYNREDIS